MARKNKPLPEVVWLQPRLALSRAISLGSFVGLVLLILIRDLIYADAHGAASWVPWLVLAFKLLPLLVVAPDCSWAARAGMPGPATWSTCISSSAYSPPSIPRSACSAGPNCYSA